MAQARVEPGVAIERATVADVATLVPLFEAYRAFYRAAPDAAAAETFLRERLERDESIVLVARDATSGEPQGLAQLYRLFSSVRMAPLLLLNDLYVVPAARRRGVGLALMRGVEAFARESGARRLMLTTQVHNRMAQRLYEAAGWGRDDEFHTYTRELRDV